MERLIKFIKGLISAIITGLIIAGIIWALLCIEVILTKKAFAYSYDVTEPCGLDAEQFEEILQDSMKPYIKLGTGPTPLPERLAYLRVPSGTSWADTKTLKLITKSSAPRPGATS